MPNLFNPNIFNFEAMLMHFNPADYQPITTLAACPLEPFVLLSRVDAHTQKIFFKVFDEAQQLICSSVAAPYYLGQVIYYRVEGIFTHIYFRQKGMAYFLYSVMLEHCSKLISDKSHSIPGSMNLWQQFHTIFPDHSVYIYNERTGSRKLYTSQPPYEIWGMDADDDFFLADKEVKVYTVEEQHQRGTFSRQQKDYFIAYIDQLDNLDHISLMLE